MVVILQPKPFWIDIWDRAGGEIIGGLVVAILLALGAIFWKTLRNGLRLLRRLLTDTPAPAPAPLQPGPQEVVLRVESFQTPARGPVEAPLSLSAAPKTYIPRPPLAGFVARRDESGRDIVGRLKTELAPEKEQLIVLWGAGGVGKTTLAAETARAMRQVFPHGIGWITADGRPDFGLSTLLDEIATHLGRPELRQLAPELKSDQVSQALSTVEPTLVVLDNFETIAVPEQRKCAEWLANRASCPALITSRDEVAHARPVQIFAMTMTEAKEFLQRLISEARNPRIFELLDHDHIIGAADRNPLVLQWLVKQIDSARQPNAVLEDLSHGKGDAASRVFDRSFELTQVGDDGRATLLALSLFVPSASRSALAEVAGFGSDTHQLDQAVQQLAELWLIETTEGNERIRVQGLTRELAKARLAKDERIDDYQRRFIHYFLQYTMVNRTNNAENFDALEAEKDNVLGAMDLAFDMGDWESVKRFAYGTALPVDGWLSVRGHWTDALRANEQALEAARQSDSSADISNFAHNLAVNHGHVGNRQIARTLHNESLELERKRGNERGVAISLHELALLAYEQGERSEARRLCDESLELRRRINDEHGIARGLHMLAVLAHNQGDFVQARKLYTESLGIFREKSDQISVATSLSQLGKLAHDEGKLDEARKLYNDSLEIRMSLGHQSGVAATMSKLARLAEEEGDRTQAIDLLHRALDIFERLNSPRAVSVRQFLQELKSK